MIAKTNSWDLRDPVSNLVLVSCDSVSMELFPHPLNEVIELDDKWFFSMYAQNSAYNFKKFIESLKCNHSLQICEHSYSVTSLGLSSSDIF